MALDVTNYEWSSLRYFYHSLQLIGLTIAVVVTDDALLTELSF